MVSINKYLAIAVVASVLLSAAFVQAEEAKDPVAEGQKAVQGLGAKIIGGIKTAKDAIMSHIPFLGKAGAETKEAAEGAAEGAEEKKEEESAPASEDAPAQEGEAAKEEEAPKEEAAAEEKKEEKAEEPATEAPAAEKSD